MNNTYNTVEEAYEAGQDWIHKSTRHEKMDFLKESCTADFIENKLMDEMVRWMGEDDFSEFYKHLCRNWGILTEPELDFQMNS